MITVTGDFHINAQSRLDDFVKSLDQIAEIANKSSLLIILGDVYHYRKPTPKEMNTFRDFINKIKVPIEIIVGNHDRDRTDSALDEFKKFKHPNISFREPPYILNSHGLSLYLNHCTVEGAEIGPYSMTLGLKEEIKVKRLKELKCDFYLVGHIHKAQVIAGNIIYPGSIERIDFGERNEKKYVVQIDEETKKFGFKELTIRPMIQQEYLIEQITGKDIDYPTFKNAIVKLIFKGTKQQLMKFDDRVYREEILKYAYSLQIVFDEIRENLKTTSTISDKISLDANFKEYAKIKQLDSETINRGLELLNEC